MIKAILISPLAVVPAFVLVCVFQAEDGIRDLVRSRGLGDVYKRQLHGTMDREARITSACSRQRTRCPFVCILASSYFRTQMANTCTATDAGVKQQGFV